MPEREPRRFTVPGCSKCHSPLEVSGYDGDLECPNAQYPNKTKHGRYHAIDLVVAVVEVRSDDSTGVVEEVVVDD